ncbi:hypothetical protein GCHA_2401 [Paraglaciecola chathamensis S18K6]|uniref:Uncharacterized protein n=1 Tax=Paraglaciecola chathamensis S18K6 TaxID=1127672 RepID=A0AAV3UZD2_9ALTE|nr:hypothetical protein GCHA_2401 [Paraglaciecola chathamensis S18K6]
MINPIHQLCLSLCQWAHLGPHVGVKFDSEEWRNISFFASLLVNLRETLKIGA